MNSFSSNTTINKAYELLRLSLCFSWVQQEPFIRFVVNKTMNCLGLAYASPELP